MSSEQSCIKRHFATILGDEKNISKALPVEIKEG